MEHEIFFLKARLIRMKKLHTYFCMKYNLVTGIEKYSLLDIEGKNVIESLLQGSICSENINAFLLACEDFVLSVALKHKDGYCDCLDIIRNLTVERQYIMRVVNHNISANLNI